MPKKIIAGNWKQNGNLKKSTKLANDIIKKIKKGKFAHDIIIFPPTIYLHPVQKINKDNVLKMGSQDVSAFDNGAYTGEVSASMLKDSKVNYCLVGHSERRHIINESEKILSEKVLKLYQSNIKIIYCIGETLDEYRGKKTKHILKKQIQFLFKKNKSHINKKPSNIIIAYEPVWAIGTGLVPSSGELSSTFKFIRTLLDKMSKPNKAIKILYGGSVSPENASALMMTNYMDGLLIGGASLNAKKFIAICSTI